MGQERPPRGLLCPGCGTGLKLLGPAEAAAAAAREGDAVAAGVPPEAHAQAQAHRMVCPRCGETFRARRRGPGLSESSELPGGPPAPPLVGSITLFWRESALWAVERAYRAGVVAGSAALLLGGGFVPVIRAWLKDQINAWPEVLETLGGVHVDTPTTDPDADLGPVLARTDAPLLFTAVNEVSRTLGVKPPAQIRLTYLPCCGMVAWGRQQALVLGLPLLRVLTVAELRAVIAHEMAHLARGDATRAARSARFVEGLRRALEDDGGRGRGPLAAWARGCGRLSSWLIGPVAWGQEARADRSAAAIAGGAAAASALVKVAVVQPLFREVLEHYDPTARGAPNLYAFFRAFWFRLPPEVHTAMRLRILAGAGGPSDPAHPPLPQRLSLLQAYPDPVQTPERAANDASPATSYLGDLEAFEQMLHNRLFGLPPVEPSLFHKAGT